MTVLRALVVLTLAAGQVAAQGIPAPDAVLGFRVGQDSMLASWRQIGDYFTRLSAGSPKIRVDTLGRTTQGRPYLLVTISDAANLARRREIMAGQRRLADPRSLSADDEARLARTQPAVILINCSIHSTEIAASQMSMELAWRLVTDSALGAALKDVVVLLVPSANPDGIDIVGDWYRESRWTRWDGTNPPWLYHPYVGHDNNRDWFMLTQPETRYLSRVLYHEWFPEVFYDVHQMGSTGARIFLPPFAEPVNPNLDPMVVGAMNHVGTAMAQALHDSGYTGVTHRSRFDLWWHGGARSTPTRHNMVGILSEAASARIASPNCLPDSALRQPPRGIDFPAPWPGGCWRLRDIVDYELVASLALVSLASREREQFIRRFVAMGRRAVEAGRRGEPYGYEIPMDQPDRAAAAHLVNLLIATGAEVHQGPGRWVVRLDQPFRAHIKDLLERQTYPDRREYPGGPPLAPYDVAGWTLPLQMGVTAVPISEPIREALERVDTARVTPGAVVGSGDIVLLPNRSNAEVTAVWRALAAGGTVQIAPQGFSAAGRRWPAGTVVVRGARAVVERTARELGFNAQAVRQVDLAAGGQVVMGVPRVALYRSWNASMDEGWTRWVFEQLGVSFTTVTDSTIRAGGLSTRFDAVILPSESEADIQRGRRAGTAPARYTGGLGEAGARALTEFMSQGGTLIALDRASRYAISQLGVPARFTRTARAPGADDENVPETASDSGNVSRFYAPGSIFEVEVDQDHPIASGYGARQAIYFNSSVVLEPGPGVRNVMFYPPARPSTSYSPLLSGYLAGAAVLANKAALVEVPVGRGRAVLFGFRPQHRGQTQATFRLLTNAILHGASHTPTRAASAGRTATGR